jgi:hypothetical protein
MKLQGATSQKASISKETDFLCSHWQHYEFASGSCDQMIHQFCVKHSFGPVCYEVEESVF